MPKIIFGRTHFFGAGGFYWSYGGNCNATYIVKMGRCPIKNKDNLYVPMSHKKRKKPNSSPC